MARAARFTTRYDAVRLASTTEEKSSSDMRRSKPSRVMPAFDTRISTGPPKCSSTALNAASTSSFDVTSQRTAKNCSGGGDEL
jgi:hypothetical protein